MKAAEANSGLRSLAAFFAPHFEIKRRSQAV